MNESKAMLERTTIVDEAMRRYPHKSMRGVLASNAFIEGAEWAAAFIRSSAPQGDGRALEPVREALAAIIQMDDDAAAAHGKPHANLNGYGLVDLFDSVGHPFGAGEHKQQPYRSNNLEAALADARAALSAPPSVALEDEDGYRAAWLEMVEHCNKLKEENFNLRAAVTEFIEQWHRLPLWNRDKAEAAVEKGRSLTRPQPGGAVAGTKWGEG